MNPKTRRRPVATHPTERGYILVWSLAVMSLVASIVLARTQEQLAASRTSRHEFHAPAHARAVADAGLTAAIAWFRAEAAQPVTAFQPRRDLEAEPPVDETDDPARGLVRSYELLPGLWARYTVHLGRAAESFTDVNGNGLYDEGEPYADDDDSGRRDEARGSRDVSVERGQPGGGMVWRLESTGEVFRRRDPLAPLESAPNERLAGARVGIEVRRLTFVAPGSAALCVGQGYDGLDACFYLVGDGLPALLLDEAGGMPYRWGATLLGTPAFAMQPDLALTPEGCFGLALSELQAVADEVRRPPDDGDGAVRLEGELEERVVVVLGDLRVSADFPLQGSGILVVSGDLIVSANANAYFSGCVLVLGDLELHGPAHLAGAVVVAGAVSGDSLTSQRCDVHHDPAEVTRLLTRVGRYRASKAPFRLDAPDAPRAGATPPDGETAP